MYNTKKIASASFDVAPYLINSWPCLYLYLDVKCLLIIVQVSLGRSGPYLSLNVPGLKERRPSLVLGDSVLLANPKVDKNRPLFLHSLKATFCTLFLTF